MAIDWAVAAALVQAAAAPLFAPPAGVPLVLTIEQRSEEAGRPARVTVAERSLVFHRDGNGWRAVLSHRGAHADASGDAFARATAAALAQPVTFRLDAAGRVTGIDAIEAVWARLTGALDATIGEHAAAPLRAMPADARREMLASMLTTVIEAAAAGEGAAAPEPVTLPAAPVTADSAPAMLAGTRSATRTGDALRIDLRAAGPLAAPPGARAEVERVTTLDPATGLIAERHERSAAWLASGAVAYSRDLRTTLRYSDTRQQTRRQP